MSLETGVVPTNFKLIYVRPLLKKPGLNPNTLNHYRPVTSLLFPGKQTEGSGIRSVKPMLNFGLFESFHSAYNYGWYFGQETSPRGTAQHRCLPISTSFPDDNNFVDV